MNEEKPKIRLRPVVYTTNTFKRGAQNTAQQMLLLKALQITQDPVKLRQLIHVRTVADVYQTLDKLAMRKDYHKALAKSGVSFEYIVDGIKKIAETGFKDADKLNALRTLLKSLGMDEYKAESIGVSGSWEETLLKTIEERKNLPDSKEEVSIPLYDVKIPQIPESAKKIQDEEEELTSTIYDEEPKLSD